MGRVKLDIKKIEKPTNRKVTYSKRGNGLIKKAYELSVLCDIDIAVIMFSPSGELTQFCKNDGIEDVITRFANTSLHEKKKSKSENLERINKVIMKLNSERELEAQRPSLAYGDHNLEVEELQSTLKKLIMQRNYFEQKARLFQDEEWINSLSSVNMIVAIEHELQQALVTVRGRQHQLAQDEAQRPVIIQQQHVLQQHGSYAHQMMEVNRQYTNPPPTSVSMVSTSHKRETGGNSESTSSLYKGASQAQPLPLTVHGSQLATERLPGAGESDTQPFPQLAKLYRTRVKSKYDKPSPRLG